MSTYHIEQPGQVVPLPPRPVNVIMPLQDEYYRETLRDRAHHLAPVLWTMTNPPPKETWDQAIQDPTKQEMMAKCLATAELCVRLVDCINSPIGT